MEREGMQNCETVPMQSSLEGESSSLEVYEKRRSIPSRTDEEVARRAQESDSVTSPSTRGSSSLARLDGDGRPSAVDDTGGRAASDLRLSRA